MSAYQVIIEDLFSPPEPDTPKKLRKKEEIRRKATMPSIVFFILFVLFGALWDPLGQSNFVLVLAIGSGLLSGASSLLILWSSPYCRYRG